MGDYQAIVSQTVEARDIGALTRLAFGRPCACLGQRDGEPKCPCKMIADEVRRQIVPSGLKYGLIVPVNKK